MFLFSLFSKKETEPPQRLHVDVSGATQTMTQSFLSFGALSTQRRQTACTDRPYDHLLKIVLLGESGAGKSSLLTRFTDNHFSAQYKSTIGVDFACKTLCLAGDMVKLQIWDTSGQERFRSITSSYYRGANMILLCFSLNDEGSFRALDQWEEQVKRYCNENVIVCVVGCKSDLAHTVDFSQGQEWARERGWLYEETSAKMSEGVDETFERVASAGHVRRERSESESDKRDEKEEQGELVARLAVGKLGEKTAMATGEALFCRGCGAAFSHLSVLSATSQSWGQRETALERAPPLHPSLEQRDETEGADDRCWSCELCGFGNRVAQSDEELQGLMPGGPVVDYLVAPPPMTHAAEAASNTVFVLDSSGSMGSSVPVKRLPAALAARRRAVWLAKTGEAGGGGGGGGGEACMTRLELLSEAVAAAVGALPAGSRAGLVVFSDDVRLRGADGQDHTVAGERLESWEELLQRGEAWDGAGDPRAVQEYLEGGLEEGGQTALGPALMLAIGGCSAGGRIVLATDGRANVGLGSLDSQLDLAAARDFYTELGEKCRLKGITVDVLALVDDEEQKGAGLGLTELMRVSEQTGGALMRVRPGEGLLARAEGAKEKRGATVAHTGLAMVCLHRGVRFRGEMDDEYERRNWLVRDLGTVHAHDSLSLGFALRPRSECNLSHVSHLPFQAQMLFVRPVDGATVLRVVSAALPLSDSASPPLHVQTVAAAAAKAVGRHLRAGRRAEATAELEAARRLIGQHHPLLDQAELALSAKSPDVAAERIANLLN